MNKTILSRILLICSLCICMSAARAQYVSIPDSNFGIWLNQNGYSSCLTSNGNNGNWQLDTTCPALFTSVSLDLSNYGYVFDCTGIQYIKGLDSLIAEPSLNGTIPLFPPSLKYLVLPQILGFNGTIILPDSLLWLTIMDANADSLSFTFPSNLISFSCPGGAYLFYPSYLLL